MIIITNPSALQAVLTSSPAVQPKVMVSYRDMAATTFVPGTQVTTLSGTTDVDILNTPAASINRVIDFITCMNINTASINLTIKTDNSGLETNCWVGTLEVNETICFFKGEGWVKLNFTGIPLAGPTISSSYDLQKFTAPGAFNWVKPVNFIPKLVKVLCCGAGGGGGGGTSSTGAVVRHGGTGGGGGALAARQYLASSLHTAESLTVGSGGTPGIGASLTAGTDGGVGGTTTFSSGQKLLSAFGGGGGYGGHIDAVAISGGAGGGLASAGTSGSTANSIGGLPGTTTASTANAGCGARSVTGSQPIAFCENGGGAGGAGEAGGAPDPAGSSIHGAGGGGAGGGATSLPAIQSPTNGGSHAIHITFNNTVYQAGGGAAGVSGNSPEPGENGFLGTVFTGGFGGGGGGGTLSSGGDGTHGGEGGLGGGGGGGGGVGENAGSGGDGGAGGNGSVYVLSW